MATNISADHTTGELKHHECVTCTMLFQSRGQQQGTALIFVPYLWVPAVHCWLISILPSAFPHHTGADTDHGNAVLADAAAGIIHWSVPVGPVCVCCASGAGGAVSAAGV